MGGLEEQVTDGFFETSENVAVWNALEDGNCTPFGDPFKPMLVLFASESIGIWHLALCSFAFCFREGKANSS